MDGDGHGRVVVERGAATTVSCGCVWFSSSLVWLSGGDSPALTMVGDRDLTPLSAVTVSFSGLLCSQPRCMSDDGSTPR